MTRFDERNAIPCYETYRNIRRIPPQRKLLEKDKELERAVNMNPQNLTVLASGILLPTDDLSDTIRLAEELSEIKLARDRELLFTQISNDTYNLAETILRANRVPCQYKRSDTADSPAKERERNHEW